MGKGTICSKRKGKEQKERLGGKKKEKRKEDKRGFGGKNKNDENREVKINK